MSLAAASVIAGVAEADDQKKKSWRERFRERWHGKRGTEPKQDHDEAYQAQSRGEILPLSTILNIALARHPGEILEIILDRSTATPVYKVVILSSSGRVRQVDINAENGGILENWDKY